MRKIVVVNNPKDWDFNIPEIEILSARDYLTIPDFADIKNVRVFNLCKQFNYQSIGYYVSLLAEARGHKVIPNVTTIQDLKSLTIIKVITDEMDGMIQKKFSKIKSDHFILSIYFGKNLSAQYDELSKQLYNLFQAPFLRAHFKFNKKWHLQNISPIPLNEIPENHRSFIEFAAEQYFAKKRYDSAKMVNYKYDLAILVNPKESECPSNKKALVKFEQVAAELGFYTEFITKDDFSRISEFDALFIRETTSVNHHTYRFARRAFAEGLVVIDDPLSIVRCTNKVYLAEILIKAKLPTPKTMIVHMGNKDKVAETLGLPCVLKKPDSSFSQGVLKVKDEESLQNNLKELLADSGLVVAQEFLPTDYDWRIGIIDKTPFFACKYYMAKGHWQIYNWKGDKADQAGLVDTLPIEEVPKNVLDIALKAANLIGNGLYGVDLKQNQNGVYIIEVNDNPSVDAGFEDRVLKDELYRIIIKSILRRVEESKLVKNV